jgi:GT2 family glycosyltransferase
LRRTLGRLRTADGADPRIAYAEWCANHTPSPEDLQRLQAEVSRLPRQPLISILTPVFNTRAQWLRAAIGSVQRQVYGRWELLLVDDASTSPETIQALNEYRTGDPRIKIIRLPANSHISAASNAALEGATGDFVALLDHDDELAPEALAEVVRYINAHPDVDFIYTDEDKLDLGGVRCDPYFKPDWSPEQFLNFMYTNHLMVLRRELVERVGRFRLGFEGSQDYDLALRIVSATDRVGHIPKVLYHWRRVPGSAAAEPTAKPWALAAARRALVDYVERNSLDAEVIDGAAPGLFHVKRRIQGQPLVSIVLTTDDRQRDVNGKLIALLPTAIRSIRQKTLYSNYEIIVIDNGRLSDATQDFLKSVPHRRVSYAIEGDFNFAHKLNFSVRHARGEHLVILNDDVEVISSNWLTAMLEYSQDPAIGAVGAKLYFADGRLQHAGVVLGVSGLAAHVFHQAPGHHPGYAGSTMGPRNYSAVTAACLMTRRAVFDEVGGFNEQLAIDFNDVDYCLKVRRAGYRIVFTPYAELYHYESTSHGQRTWRPDEVEYMRRTWPDVIAADPYYNVNLTRDFADYRLRA